MPLDVRAAQSPLVYCRFSACGSGRSFPRRQSRTILQCPALPLPRVPKARSWPFVGLSHPWVRRERRSGLCHHRQCQTFGANP